MPVTAGQAGDESLGLHLGTGASNDGSIPITVRALVPLGASGGSFAGDTFNLFSLSGDEVTRIPYSYTVG